MTFFGGETEYYERILFMAFAIIAGILCGMQLIFYQELKLVPVYLLPFLSFCICFENIALYRQENIGENSSLATAAKVFHAFIMPLFVLLVYEVPFRLHETRLAHFGCIPFEQGSDMPDFIALFFLWFERAIAAGLFVMGIVVNFNLLPEDEDSEYSGVGGYMTLAKHPRSLHLWLSLIPPMFLSAMAIYICVVLYKYAKHCTLGISNNRYWRAIIPCTAIQAAGECFGTNVYQVTSNAGNLSLLIGVTFIVGLVQRDLVIAGSFANFLNKSNRAFANVSTLGSHSSPPETPPRNMSRRLEAFSAEEDSNSNSLNITIADNNEERVANLA